MEIFPSKVKMDGFMTGGVTTGWGSLNRTAGLIGSRIKVLTVELLLVGPYCVARNTCGTLNLALAGPGFQQGPNGGLQMQFQDVHSG